MKRELEKCGIQKMIYKNLMELGNRYSNRQREVTGLSIIAKLASKTVSNNKGIKTHGYLQIVVKSDRK